MTSRTKARSTGSPSKPSRRTALGTASAIALTAIGGFGSARAADNSVKTRNSTPDPFDSVLIDAPVTVTISVGDTPAVTISAEQAVLDVLVAEVSDGQLAVRTNGSFQTQKPVNVVIVAAELIALDTQSSCDVTVEGPLDGELALSVFDSSTVSLEDMNLSALIADIQGSSEVLASGKSASLQLTTAGASSFSGADLAVSTASLEVGGSSEATVDVADRLTVSITDAGSVYYSGNPEIEQSVSFAGTFESSQ